MREADIDYDIACEGGPRIVYSIRYGIEFETEGRGTDDASVKVKATPIEIQIMSGGMPFGAVQWDPRAAYGVEFREFVLARAKAVTLQECGFSMEEAFSEACEEEDELAYIASQIGRPL
jgi:hypothetical protein